MLSARRLLTVAAVSAAALVVPLSGAASAHVTVQAPGATQGGYTKLTFRMPTEREVPSTGLEVAFPDEHPITSLRVKPKAGWTYEIVRAPLDEPIEVHGRQITERVSRIVWTATGEGVGPTEFEEFEVSGGPMPEVESLTLPALQTYADGEVVRWIEEAAEGAEEPEKPAPVLELAAASDEGHGAAVPETEVDAEPAAAVSGTSDWVPGVALGVAVLALLAALSSLVLRRRG
ncbi:MAG TPA: YcnI family protein [Mycobacteriales bacterium]|nr:YcnI family protein [Mycobacteriales bacterium]